MAFKAPDVVLLVQRHQGLPVLQVLRAAGAPVLQHAAPVGPARLNMLRSARLRDDVRASVEVVIQWCREKSQQQFLYLNLLTGRSNWILHRKLKYHLCCLRDVTLKIEIDLSNSI